MNKTYFLFIIIILLFTSCSNKKTDTIKLVIGTYTSETSEGIYSIDFDTLTGDLSNLQLVYKIDDPTFQQYDAKTKVLWSVGKKDGKSMLTNFKLMPDGNFELIDTVFTKENGICHVAYNGNLNIAVASNYRDGSITQVQYDDNYQFRSLKIDHHFGKGVNIDRQEAPHAHSVTFRKNQNTAYACDLGADKIYIYKTNNGWLTKVDSIITKPGSGPRHLAFNPDGKSMAVLNELNSTIDLYALDSKNYYKKLIARVSTLPDTCNSFTKAADIRYSPNGEFIYASNRGCNSIAVFRQIGMYLKLIEIETERCNWIRNFAISHNGKFLIAANRYGNNIMIYEIDQTTGELNCLHKSIEVNQPVCITPIE